MRDSLSLSITTKTMVAQDILGLNRGMLQSQEKAIYVPRLYRLTSFWKDGGA